MMKFNHDYLMEHIRDTIHIRNIPIDFTIDDLAAWVKEVRLLRGDQYQHLVAF